MNGVAVSENSFNHSLMNDMINSGLQTHVVVIFQLGYDVHEGPRLTVCKFVPSTATLMPQLKTLETARAKKSKICQILTAN